MSVMNNKKNEFEYNYKYKVIGRLDEKVDKTLEEVQVYKLKQEEFLTKIKKMNRFLAEELDNNNNHNTRKVECKDKIEEMKMRIENVKEKLNSARGLLLKTVNNQKFKEIIENKK